jgi:hypothetical protein
MEVPAGLTWIVILNLKKPQCANMCATMMVCVPKTRDAFMVTVGTSVLPAKVIMCACGLSVC